ncbi:MAG: phage tail sheath C-terminal domain-containing protein, partial [Polyangiales bacterium]
GSDDDLFNVINRDSQVLVAIDAVFETDLPVTQPAPLDLPAAAARAAAGTLQGAGGALIDLIATTPGRAGNDIRFEVQAGRASLVLLDAGSNPAIRIRARQRGDEGVGVRINATANPTEGIDVTVQGLLGATRRYEGFTDNAALVDALNADPDIAAERLGDVPPAALVALAPLTATRSVILTRTGVSTARFEDLTNAAAVVSALTEHGLVQPTLLGDATAALDATPTNAFALSGGRDAGRARGYRGQNTPDDDVLELVPLDSSDPALTRVQVAAGTHAGTVRVIVGVEADGAFRQRELFDDLTMDPDSERYLPVVLQASTLVRAVDLFRPSGATDFPHASAEPDALSGGAAPSLAAYQAAIDALEGEDAVDLLLTGLQEWKDPNLDGLAVQQYALGHARTQADNARPRIAIGSIAPSETSDIRAVTAHAGQVRDRRFVLVAPSGSEGALAGLLGHLEFFQSPTFKTLASLGADPHSYSDGELNQLLGPDANVCVLQQRKGRGLICVRGLSTSGDQISVTRVADRCVREVKAISDRFIGELNNAESRNALKQMIVATFTQLERDGALVPSVDNKEPAFIVDVYASQNDTAGGIVRVDIAVRPVRAIDYVYATITVKN